MSLHSETFDEEGSEALEQFDDIVDDDPYLPPSGQLLRSFSGSNLNLHDDMLNGASRDSSPRHPRPDSRRLSRCSSRRALQEDQSRRLSVATHQRTDDVLSEIIEEELRVKKKFSGKRSSCRDKSKKVEEVLFADAVVIRAHLEQLRTQVRNASEEKSNTAGTTEDSKLLLLRKVKRNLLERFQDCSSSRSGMINRECFGQLLNQVGVVQQQPSEKNSKATRLFIRFWNIVAKESDSDGVTFATFYRYIIVIMFPILLRLLNEGHQPTDFEKQFLDEASAIPVQNKAKRRINVFASGLDAVFMSSLARNLIENANLIRLLQPIRHPPPSSEDEFDFRPEVTPRSERLARRRRHQSGRRRFSEELQQHARDAQRRRDADEAKKYETQLAGCTFRPTVNGKSSQSHRSYDSKSRFEQLYEIGVHQVENRRCLQRCRSESPVPYRPFHMKSVPAAVMQERPLPRGFQETVERSRRAFRQRLRKKAEHEHLGQQFVERYDRRERRAAASRAEEAKPIHDRYADWYERLLQSRRRPDPLLYVDINIGHGRFGRISVYPDSEAGVLSRNFARVFDLDRDMQERLAILLERHCKRVQGRRLEADLTSDDLQGVDESG